jgi:hypothetical protein
MLYGMWINPIKARLQSGVYTMLIVCVDKSWLVPKRKTVEQARRDQSRKKTKENKEKEERKDKKKSRDGVGTESMDEAIRKKMLEFGIDPHAPYPADAVIDDNGIQLRSQMTSAWFPVNIDRLLAVRPLRRYLFEYFHAKIMQDPAMAPYPVVFDYDKEPSLVLNGKTVALFDYVHPFGEADLMLSYWANVYNARDVVIQTIDGDVIPIMAYYVDKVKPTGSLWWQYDKTKFVNLKLLYAELGMNPNTLIILCLLCGTDYCNKSDLLHFVGVEYIFNRLALGARDVTDTFKLSARYLKDEKEVWPHPMIPNIYLDCDKDGKEPYTDAMETYINVIIENSVKNSRKCSQDMKQGLINLNWHWQYLAIDYKCSMLVRPEIQVRETLMAGVKYLQRAPSTAYEDKRPSYARPLAPQPLPTRENNKKQKTRPFRQLLPVPELNSNSELGL